MALLQLIVGLGSSAFHGTLKYEAQLLDELPMVYLGLGFVYCMLEDKPWRKYHWLAPAMVIGAIAYSLAYIYIGDWVFFFLPFSLLVAPHAVYFLRWRHDPTIVKTGLASNCLFIVAFVAWHLDQQLCPSAEFLQLHALWHLLTAFSTTISLTLFEYIRWRHLLKCRDARIRYRYYLLPMCAVDGARSYQKDL